MSTPLPQETANSQQLHRRELLLSIYRLLSSNGQNARPVYNMAGKLLPKGGMQELVKIRPYDAVRAEIGGTTMTVEVTPNRHGVQEDPDALCYACYNLKDFENWFFDVLQKAGLQPYPPANVPDDVVKQFMNFLPSGQIRPDLRPAPMFHRKKKGGK